MASLSLTPPPPPPHINQLRTAISLTALYISVAIHQRIAAAADQKRSSQLECSQSELKKKLQVSFSFALSERERGGGR